MRKSTKNVNTGRPVTKAKANNEASPTTPTSTTSIIDDSRKSTKNINTKRPVTRTTTSTTPSTIDNSDLKKVSISSITNKAKKTSMCKGDMGITRNTCNCK
jgi:hypothetical protein